MQFTNEYFPDHIKNWEIIFSDFKGGENLNYLEVGVFEGQSAFWMKEKILNHPTCEITLVDLFHPSYEETFLKNLKEIDSHNIVIHKGKSSDILKSLPSNYFDIIYIDAGHIAKDIFLDLAFSWELLKINGTLIIDDYPLLEGKAPVHMRPGMVIDCFITAFSEEIELVQKDWQVVIKKIEKKLKNPNPLSWNKYQKIGNYFYDWHKHILIDENGVSAKIVLNSKENVMLEQILMNIKIGDQIFSIDSSLKDKDLVVKLIEKLG